MSSDAELIERLAGASSSDNHLTLIVNILRSHEYRLQSFETIGCTGIAGESGSSCGLQGAGQYKTPSSADLAPSLGAEVHMPGGSGSACFRHCSAAHPHIATSRDSTSNTRAQLGPRVASDKLERIQVLNDLRDNLDARLAGIEAAFQDLASRVHERMEDIVIHVGQMMQETRTGQKQQASCSPRRAAHIPVAGSTSPLWASSRVGILPKNNARPVSGFPAAYTPSASGRCGGGRGHAPQYDENQDSTKSAYSLGSRSSTPAPPEHGTANAPGLAEPCETHFDSFHIPTALMAHDAPRASAPVKTIVMSMADADLDAATSAFSPHALATFTSPERHRQAPKPAGRKDRTSQFLLDQPASTPVSRAFPSRPQSPAQRPASPSVKNRHVRDIGGFDANAPAYCAWGTSPCMQTSPPTHGSGDVMLLERRPATAPPASELSTARARASAQGTADDRSDGPRKMYTVHDTPADILRSKRRLAEFNDRLHTGTTGRTNAVNQPDALALSIGFHPM